MRSRLIQAFLLLAGLGAPAFAHQIRPAYLELREARTGGLDVLWKTPMVGELRLALAPVLSGRSEELAPMATRRTGSAAVQTWRLRLVEPLRGRSLRIDGLEATLTDALVRIEFADGTTWVARLTPQAPQVTIPERQSRGSVAATYLELGVEHILTGVDHLLFVLALIIIARGGWKLVKTVTAFTIAHSITLTAATLGFVHMPQRPVEAVIALSIVFVATEIVHGRQGREGIAARAPWIVALTFGLLHGLGFAGGLSDAGLPQGHIPGALLFFSVGVETGHFLFVGVVLSLIALGRHLKLPAPHWARLVPAYGIGSVAIFWLIQRVAAF